MSRIRLVRGVFAKFNFVWILWNCSACLLHPPVVHGQPIPAASQKTTKDGDGKPIKVLENGKVTDDFGKALADGFKKAIDDKVAELTKEFTDLYKERNRHDDVALKLDEKGNVPQAIVEMQKAVVVQRKILAKLGDEKTEGAIQAAEELSDRLSWIADRQEAERKWVAVKTLRTEIVEIQKRFRRAGDWQVGKKRGHSTF